ncbi:MAG: DUF2461 domain-containing protein [Prevotellaceae bacterium]|jgi:uncharacterized protein (TIGR02453 family)|nr:DUF2461 domain-containing protein [Prevotellaceae bacterium]
MNIPVIFQFLNGIAANNNREWFLAHKALYEAARGEFETLLAAVINRISLFDESIRGIQPKDCTYRIYRDVRFSYDKSPYKNHLGGYINARGKKSPHSGYYLHIEPGNCLLAGGSYDLPPKIFKAVRQAVYENMDEFRSIVEDPAFKQYFPVVGEDFLKTMPKGYPKDYPYGQYLKCRVYTCYGALSDDFFTRPDFLDYTADAFAQLKRFNDFLNYTIDEETLKYPNDAK